MNWGKSIAVAFILFAAFISVLVVVCMREDVSLVSTKYYEEDLHFQQQYDQVSNSKNLSSQPEFALTNEAIFLNYRDFARIEQGKLTVMRPSDETLDYVFELKPGVDTLQQFYLKNVKNGLYKVRLEWKEAGVAYRIDKTLVL